MNSSYALSKKSFLKRFFAVAIVLLALCTSAAIAAPFQYGDVFAATGSGTVQHYNSAGTLIETLNTGNGGFTTGMAFDSAQNLYVTNFDTHRIAKFDNNGILVTSNFGTGYGTDSPESILFDSAGNAYVGQVDATQDILKLDSAGNLLARFDVDTDDRGADWIDLASDQCTMFYTSEGYWIKRYDVCNNVQMADYYYLGARPAFALRLLSDNTILVADSENIKRVDITPSIIQTYDATDTNNWFALNLDPDTTSFWSGDYGNGHFYKFDIATGAQLLDVNTGSDDLFGLVVFGEQTQTTGSISGMKFNDINGNGVKDAGDNGLEGWTIVLKDSSGATIATTTTAADGSYSFGSLPVGTYTVSEVLQAGWTQTAPSGRFYIIPIASGEDVIDKDFGNTGGNHAVPEFPSMFLPAALIIGLIGAVLFIRKSKEN